MTVRLLSGCDDEFENTDTHDSQHLLISRKSKCGNFKNIHKVSEESTIFDDKRSCRFKQGCFLDRCTSDLFARNIISVILLHYLMQMIYSLHLITDRSL